MLVLSRRQDESVFVGPDVEIVVLSVDGPNVRLGIRAPREVSIIRAELLGIVKEENHLAAGSSLPHPEALPLQ